MFYFLFLFLGFILYSYKYILCFPFQTCNCVQSASSIAMIPDYRTTRWRNWLRHCATSRKAAVSIPDGVIRIFRWPWGMFPGR